MFPITESQTKMNSDSDNYPYQSSPQKMRKARVDLLDMINFNSDEDEEDGDIQTFEDFIEAVNKFDFNKNE